LGTSRSFRGPCWSADVFGHAKEAQSTTAILKKLRVPREARPSSGARLVDARHRTAVRGADLIIVDDPLNSGEAYSKPAHKWVIDWLCGTRLNDKETGSACAELGAERASLADVLLRIAGHPAHPPGELRP
jgi:hypothetical protein